MRKRVWLALILPAHASMSQEEELIIFLTVLMIKHARLLPPRLVCSLSSILEIREVDERKLLLTNI